MRYLSTWKTAVFLSSLVAVLVSVQAKVSSSSLGDAVATSVIDSEIRATQEYVELLIAKASLLQRMIAIQQDQVTKHETYASKNATSMHRRSPNRPPKSHERFDDWFAPQAPWLSPESHPAASTNRAISPSTVHVEFLSFRQSGSVGGKKNTQTTRRDVNDSMRPMLEFIMMLNKQSGNMDLYDPSTKALVWQQRVEIPAPITNVHFHSDRGAHLVLLTRNGDLLLYTIRIFHGRRLVAGDYRRSIGAERSWCKFHVHLPPQNRVVNSAPRAWSPLAAIFVTDTSVQRTLSPPGLHTHLDLELAFVKRLPMPPSVVTTVVSYQAFYIVAGTPSGELAFFHGQNGSLIGTLPTALGPIRHLEVVSSGVVAFTVANRIHFVDVNDRRLLDLTCEGSRHNITSLDRDLWRHSALYAGTSDGTGLAFRINRFGSIKRTNGLTSLGADADGLTDSDDTKATCSLTAVLRPRVFALSNTLRATANQPAIVRALPGYALLSSGDGHLVLYEASSSSSGAPVYLTEKPLAAVQAFPSSQVVSVIGMSDLHVGGIVAVALTVWEPEHSRFSVELLASRLPPQSSSIDIGWIRAPMMLLCAVGVMFWQQNKVRRPSSSSMLDFDLPAMRGYRKGHASGSDWSRSANHRMRGGF